MNDLKFLLEEAYETYHTVDFVDDDPISIPKSYTLKQDIEITAFWTSILSWGQRKTIINKCQDLFGRMDHAPYDFVRHFEDSDLKSFSDFKHRTFQPPDVEHFLRFFKWHYSSHDSMEDLFVHPSGSLELGMNQFRMIFFNSELAHLKRTEKHVAAPSRKSTCKRVNMFLRWMVRQGPVDFGIWNKLSPSQLYIPYDVHVERVARILRLVDGKKKDWTTVVSLTEKLKSFDPHDPVKYDFALFGLSVNNDLERLSI